MGSLLLLWLMKARDMAAKVVGGEIWLWKYSGFA